MLCRYGWYRDGSKAEHAARTGIYSASKHLQHSYPLGQHTPVSQEQVYAILQCARNINLLPERNIRINIPTDSQTALRAHPKSLADFETVL